MEQEVTLLIVDDKEYWRFFIKQTLINIIPGNRIIEAENGLDGLKKLYANQQIKIITSDSSMPIMNGFRFIEKVRADPRYSAIPIILLTCDYISPEYTEFAQKNNVIIIAKDSVAGELWKIVADLIKI